MPSLMCSIKKLIKTILCRWGYTVGKNATIEVLTQENASLKSQLGDLDCLLNENKQLRQRILELERPPIARVVGFDHYPVSPEFAHVQMAGAALEKLIRDYEFQSVIDIGAGAQQHSQVFAQFGKHVTAVDYGNSVYHKRKTVAEKSRIVEIIGDFNKIQFHQQFDCVWASHILEHQPDVSEFLSKAISVLKEGGVLAITVPPFKNEIVGGHVSVWNAGLILYRLVLAGIDCKHAAVLAYDYNTSVIVEKRSISEMSKLDLHYDSGDIRKLKRYLPDELKFNSNVNDDPFDGDIRKLNWDGNAPVYG